MGKKRGFTLIELLVVVSIIAVLSSITMAFLGDARKKGADSAVKANLSTVRAQSGVFFSTNNNSYLPSGGSTFSINTCPTYNASGTNMFSVDASISGAIAEAVNRAGNGSSCYNSSDVWAVAVGLRTNTSASWCIDASGVSREVPSAPGSAINGSGLCN